MTWYRCEAMFEVAYGSVRGAQALLDEAAPGSWTRDGVVGWPLRDAEAHPAGFLFTLEAVSVSAAWLQALVVVNRAGAVAGCGSKPLTSMTVQVTS